MSSRSRRLAVAALSLGAMAISLPAYAASGSGGGGGGGGGGTGGGGGGTTPTVGAIQRASAGATCDAGTVMGVSVDKGFNKRVEVQLSFSGMAAGKYMSVRLTEDGTGRLISGWGTFPSSPSALITTLGSTVAPGPVELSFIEQLHEGSLDGPVLETCTAHISTFAK